MIKTLFTSYLCGREETIIEYILSSWKEKNPDFEILYFSDSDVKEFFKDLPYFDTYKKMKNGPKSKDMKMDIRYLVFSLETEREKKPCSVY